MASTIYERQHNSYSAALASEGPSDEALYTCPRCDAVLPLRRAKAHETTWCPALVDKENESSDDGSNLDQDSAGVRLRNRAGKDPNGGHQRYREEVDANGDAILHGLNHGGRQRCPDASNGCCAGEDVDEDDEDAYVEESFTGGVDPLADTAAQSQRRTLLNFCFLLLMVAPACCGAFFTLQAYFSPLVLQVSKSDAATVQRIFFGGDPWLVYCVNKRTEGRGHLKTLTKAAEQLQPQGVRTAEVHCWSPLQTRKGPRTLAQRFKFRDKPPVVLVVSGQTKPRLLNSNDFNVDSLVRQALQHSHSSTPPGADTRVPPSKQRTSKGKSGAPREHVGRRPKEEDPLQTPPSAEMVDDENAGGDEAEDVVDLDA